eukprot:COSAG02_NODE_10154_length_2007_cov_2.777778_1_plen_68_part_00
MSADDVLYRAAGLCSFAEGGQLLRHVCSRPTHPPPVFRLWSPTHPPHLDEGLRVHQYFSVRVAYFCF